MAFGSGTPAPIFGAEFAPLKLITTIRRIPDALIRRKQDQAFQFGSVFSPYGHSQSVQRAAREATRRRALALGRPTRRTIKTQCDSPLRSSPLHGLRAARLQRPVRHAPFRLPISPC